MCVQGVESRVTSPNSYLSGNPCYPASLGPFQLSRCFLFRLTVLPSYFCTQLGVKPWPGVMRCQMADLLLMTQLSTHHCGIHQAGRGEMRLLLCSVSPKMFFSFVIQRGEGCIVLGASWMSDCTDLLCCNSILEGLWSVGFSWLL